MKDIEIPNIFSDTRRIAAYSLVGAVGIAPIFRRTGIEILEPGYEGLITGALVGLYDVIDYRRRFNSFLDDIFINADNLDNRGEV